LVNKWYSLSGLPVLKNHSSTADASRLGCFYFVYFWKCCRLKLEKHIAVPRFWTTHLFVLMRIHISPFCFYIFWLYWPPFIISEDRRQTKKKKKLSYFTHVSPRKFRVLTCSRLKKLRDIAFWIKICFLFLK